MSDTMSHEAQHQIQHRRYYKYMDIGGENTYANSGQRLLEPVYYSPGIMSRLQWIWASTSHLECSVTM